MSKLLATVCLFLKWCSPSFLFHLVPLYMESEKKRLSYLEIKDLQIKTDFYKAKVIPYFSLPFLQTKYSELCLPVPKARWRFRRVWGLRLSGAEGPRLNHCCSSLTEVYLSGSENKDKICHWFRCYYNS